jgi:phosphomannomutase
VDEVVCMTLRLASFGIRGFVGQSLTPKVVIDFASAFGTYLHGGRVLVGRDTRTSSPMLHSAVISALLSCGCEVLDFGVCPAPILQFSVKLRGAAGAVSTSGGHNGMGWNAVTLIGPDGAQVEPVGGELILDTLHARDFLKQDYLHVGTVRAVDDFAVPYFDALEAHLNAAAIRAAGLTALIDPVGGAGCAYLEPFAQRFGVKLVAINAQPSGYLAREPEPRPRSALQIASFIGHVKGDVGFVLSSDMGRLSIVTEDGEPASEEFSFAVIADHLLAKQKGTVVTNCCTTRMIEDIAARHGSRVVKAPVGQAYVVSALADEGGILGGEGSGSVARPSFSRAFDGFLMMGLILEALAEQKCTVSAMLKRMPRYHIVKRRIPCGARQFYHALEVLGARLRESGGTLDLTDGIRVDWEDGWIHARASKTEQLIRVISEARDRVVAERRAEEATRIVEQGI